MDQNDHFTIIGETIDSGPIIAIYKTFQYLNTNIYNDLFKLKSQIIKLFIYNSLNCKNS